MAGSMSYHMEARLKQDRMNRWQEQKRSAEFTHQGLEEKHEDVAYKQKMGTVISTDPGQFNQIRTPPLIPFRVNQDGFNNRYQKRQHLNPHVDRAFVTIYAGKDNFDYKCNDNQVHRRLNSAMDKYQVSRKVNGDFLLQPQRDAQAVAQSVHSWTGPERNRRFYDYSCKGPVLGNSWRELHRELNFRERCLAPAALQGLTQRRK